MTGPTRPGILCRRPRGLRWCVVLLALAAVLLGGCRDRAQNTSAPSAETRVGVVDLAVVTRAHPDWQELDAVARQVQDVQAQLAQLPTPPAADQADLQRMLDAEAQRLRVELTKELEFLRLDGQRRLETYANEIRSEQEARLEQTRRDLEAQGEQDLMAKHDELRAQLRAAEQAVRDEYRYPLLNLRLRAEVAGLTSEEEAKQMLQQMQALQQEREGRIQAKADEMQQSFAEFQKTAEADINAKLRAAQDAVQLEGQQRLAAREREAQAELTRAAAELEKTFRARLDARRRQIVQMGQIQLQGRQGTYTESLSERSRRLQAELAALQQQRARLEDSILAEVKIEVAAIAQERKLDVVLTRYITNVTGLDITADVVAKLKR